MLEGFDVPEVPAVMRRVLLVCWRLWTRVDSVAGGI